jgi:hypothetical protein
MLSGGDDEVAGGSETAAASQRRAIDNGDNRFSEFVDDPEEVCEAFTPWSFPAETIALVNSWIMRSSRALRFSGRFSVMRAVRSAAV